jgi:hypothetical protein
VCIMKFSDWARKELERGDLTALSELTKGTAWGDPNPGRIERLNRRGFVCQERKSKTAGDLKRASRPLGQATL